MVAGGRDRLGAAHPPVAAADRRLRPRAEPGRAHGPPRAGRRGQAQLERGLWGPLPGVLDAAAAALDEAWAYPEHAYHALREAIGAEMGVPPEQVLPGHERLSAALRAGGIAPVASSANFVLAGLGVDDVALAERLVRRGILVRPGAELGCRATRGSRSPPTR